MKTSGVTLEALKIITDYFARIDKDFSYLTHPSKLPRAYEKALMEVSRRKKFRRLIDEECNRLKQAIGREKDSRAVFMSEYGRLLPSEFIPQLREQVCLLRLEGGMKDYELPDISEDIGNYDLFLKEAGNGEGDPML